MFRILHNCTTFLLLLKSVIKREVNSIRKSSAYWISMAMSLARLLNLHSHKRRAFSSPRNLRNSKVGEHRPLSSSLRSQHGVSSNPLSSQHSKVGVSHNHR
jgi:hypothetical protein